MLLGPGGRSRICDFCGLTVTQISGFLCILIRVSTCQIMVRLSKMVTPFSKYLITVSLPFLSSYSSPSFIRGIASSWIRQHQTFIRSKAILLMKLPPKGVRNLRIVPMKHQRWQRRPHIANKEHGHCKGFCLVSEGYLSMVATRHNAQRRAI